MHPQPRPFAVELFLDFCAIFSPNSQGVSLFFLGDIHHFKCTNFKITTNQANNLYNRKSQRMGFFSKKKWFCLQNQKNRGKILQPWKSNRPSTNISNLAWWKDRSVHGGETEQTNLPLWSIRVPFFEHSVFYSRDNLKRSWSLFVRLPLCAAFFIREPFWKARDLYSRAFLWALRLVFFGCVQWNTSIVVLYISLVYGGERYFVSRRSSVSWIFGPKTFCLTTQLFGLGATNSLV